MARVGLTTTSDRALDLTTTVESLGHEPVVLPCIQLRPSDVRHLKSARDACIRTDWLFVTSARAVGVLWPEGGIPDVRVAAVGTATAEAVRRAGRSPDVVGSSGAAQLVSRIEGELSGSRVFFPHAVTTDLSVIDLLESAGALVDSRPVYDVRPVAPPETRVDAVTFGSPSAVTGWCLSRSFDDVVVGAIGATTAGALVERGRHPDVVPARPDFPRLILMIDEFLKERSAV